MKKISALWAGGLLAGTALMFSAQAQTPPEPGATPGVEVINISKNTPNFGSVFPQVAVSRKDPNLVAVAWRQYGLPIDTNALRENRHAECYVSISHDAGKTFTARNMMDVLRTPGGNGQPLLWGCNAPWVTIANDGTMYFGGALYTAGGTVQVEPKAGRAGVSASTDGGKTWSKMVPGIMLDRFQPGMTGLNGGMNQEDTPWDGANGFVDPITGTMYSTAGATISASDDKGKSFGPVYVGKGTASAAFGNIIAARNVAAAAAAATPVTANAKCPCLVASVSSDKGKTWTETLVAQATQWDSAGTVRYPIPAASPAKAGNYAIGVYQPGHQMVKVYYTSDNGKTWKMSSQRPYPANMEITNANQMSVGYTNDGRILVTWRAFKNMGSFNTFVAMVTNDRLGPSVKVSPEISIYPPLTWVGNYGNGTGGGDFTTWVHGNNDYALVAFPYMPGGLVEDTYLARVPLNILK